MIRFNRCFCYIELRDTTVRVLFHSAIVSSTEEAMCFFRQPTRDSRQKAMMTWNGSHTLKLTHTHTDTHSHSHAHTHKRTRLIFLHVRSFAEQTNKSKPCNSRQALLIWGVRGKLQAGAESGALAASTAAVAPIVTVLPFRPLDLHCCLVCVALHVSVRAVFKVQPYLAHGFPKPENPFNPQALKPQNPKA